MRRINQFLKQKDISWEALGVLLAIIAILISTFVSYDILKKEKPTHDLNIEEIYSTQPFAPLAHPQIPFLLVMPQSHNDPFGNQPIMFPSSFSAFYFKIVNTGQTPILPNDFINPIEIHVQEPWSFRTVILADSNPPDLKLNWEKKEEDTILLKPLLLNPGDTLQIGFFLTSHFPQKAMSMPHLHWTGRIANINHIIDPYTPKRSFFQQTMISLSGYEVTLVLLTAFIFISTTIWFAIKSNLIVSLSRAQKSILILIIFLSFSSAEILIDLFVRKNLKHQWIGSWPLLGIHLILFLFLAWSYMKNKKGKINSAIDPIDLSRYRRDPDKDS